MKENKHHIYLCTEERNQIIASLINLKNKLIEQGGYTDAVGRYAKNLIFAMTLRKGQRLFRHIK